MATDINIKISDVTENIAKKLALSKNKSLISAIDSIKITRDLLKPTSTILQELKKYPELHEQDYEYKFIYDTLVNHNYLKYILLGNNHFNNLLIDINFVLGNPYLFESDVFDIIYKKRKHIRRIPKIIRKCWNYILNSELINFFNSTLINKWLQTSVYKKFSKQEVFNAISCDDSNKELIYKKYLRTYSIFNKMNKNVIRFITRLQTKITSTQNPGCYNLKNNEYLHFVRIYTGLNLTYANLDTLVAWAVTELSRLTQEMRIIIQRVRPDLASLDIIDIIKALHADPQYKYKSKEEFIDHHKQIMDKMHDFFINQKQIKEFNKPKLTIIDNETMGGAYWAYDTFYLNVANWDKINTYQALPLTLHEGVPGHHTQLNYCNNAPTNKCDLLYAWFGMCNGFSEGWALFTELLAPNYTDLERIGQLQYEILRTTRIISDISIHASGKSPDQIINFMKKYLAMPDKSIESETYRYVVLPGQALCYKIGCAIIKKIYEKVVGGTDLLSDKSINFYKELIYNKNIPLDVLMKQYNITFTEVFQV